MKKWILLLGIAGIFLFGCGKEEGKTEAPEASPLPSGNESVLTGGQPTPTGQGEPTGAPSPTEAAPSPTEAPAEFSFADAIPYEALRTGVEKTGTIEMITYETKDYFGDGAVIEKNAYVYLPYGYDKEKKYNVLYLMHGIGGNEKEWGMYNDSSKVKRIMDNLIADGTIEPFLIVTPNGRSGKDFANTSSDYNSFYEFGKELRNDLILYIESHYATWADATEEGYDMAAAREHRAMAGLSMGGMQTINIGMCECLDLFGWFGAFSAAPTSYTADKIAEKLQEFPDLDIRYFYAVCGTEDQIALSSAKGAVNGLTSYSDRLDDSNFYWQTLPGVHDFNIWYLGFYNFSRVVFAK